MTNPNESAFAKSAYVSNEGTVDPPQEGLTKREYFAAMAIQGLLANSVYHNPNEKHKMVTVPALSETATHYADALIKALNEKP